MIDQEMKFFLDMRMQIHTIDKDPEFLLMHYNPFLNLSLQIFRQLT